ncbi:MAG TPA: ribose-5-phosphate isomerase [Actinomycetes bacterium]
MVDKRYRMAVGSDDAGVHLKDYIRDRLKKDPRVVEVTDFGVADTSDKTPYPIVCIKVAEAVARGEFDRAVLFGGTGLGEAISANKVKGIRAVVATDPFSIERSILSNNCQIIALGERVVAPELAARIVSDWLGYEFDPSSPSAAKVQTMIDYEERGTL